MLLLEAGPRDTDFWIHVPLGYGKLFSRTDLNWAYESEPEPALNDRRIFTPRGKVLGGSSSINGLVYIRGQREDFDGWAIPGWGFDDLLPYFRKSENQSRGADLWHGVGGALAVSDLPRHELCDAFIASAMALGIPRNDDFNGATQEGTGYYQATASNGRRCSTAVGYLRPAEKRPNVKIEVKTKANFIRSAQEKSFFAAARSTRRSFSSCRASVRERCSSGTAFRSTLNDDVMSLWRMAIMGLRYFLFKQGPLTVSAGHAAAFVRTRPELKRPDAQLYFINFSTARRGGVLHRHSGFTCAVSQLQVESRGSVHLRSADPAAAPAIRYNYLATENDRRVMVEGLKLVRRIVNTAPLRDYIRAEYLPGPGVQGDSEWLDYCRGMGETVFHPTSTCRIGAVVDEKLKVKGLRGLRVIDASVMPAVPSGNINAAVIAVAEKGADLVKEDA